MTTKTSPVIRRAAVCLATSMLVVTPLAACDRTDSDDRAQLSTFDGVAGQRLWGVWRERGVAAARPDAVVSASTSGDEIDLELREPNGAVRWAVPLAGGFTDRVLVRLVDDRVLVMGQEGNSAGDRMRAWMLDASDGRVIREQTVDTDEMTAPDLREASGFGNDGMLMRLHASPIPGVMDHPGDTTVLAWEPDAGESIPIPESLPQECPDGPCDLDVVPMSVRHGHLIYSAVQRGPARYSGGPLLPPDPAIRSLFGVSGGWDSRALAPQGADPWFAVVTGASQHYLLGRWEAAGAAAGEDPLEEPVDSVYGLIDIRAGKLVAAVPCTAAKREDYTRRSWHTVRESPNAAFVTAGPLYVDVNAGRATCLGADPQSGIRLMGVNDQGLAYGFKDAAPARYDGRQWLSTTAPSREALAPELFLDQGAVLLVRSGLAGHPGPTATTPYPELELTVRAHV